MTISSTSGLVSNIDYQSLISQLLAVKQQPLDMLTASRNKLDQTNSAYSTLSTRVTDLRSAADTLRTAMNYSVFTTSVSDQTMLGASSNATAAPGLHTVVISTLAKAHKIAANGVASDTAATIAAAPGFFKFQVGATGAVQSVAVGTTTTLATLRDSINNLNAGVSASIINDGTASPFRLVLTSNNSGTANAITITQNDTSLVFNTATPLQAAQDATFSVDGFSYTRSTNSISDVVTGVTFNLLSADPAKTVTVGVNRDTAQINKSIVSLVDKYNAVISYVKANNRYDGATKTGGVFFGDSTARGIVDDLRRSMTGMVSGLSGAYNSLASLGIATGADGTMSIDSAKLSTALTNKYTDVVNLLVKGTTTTGVAAAVYNAADSIGGYGNSRIQLAQKALSANMANMDGSIRRMQDGLTDYERQIRAQFTALETLLAGLKRQGSYLAGLG